jgi:hypothetical protein
MDADIEKGAAWRLEKYVMYIPGRWGHRKKRGIALS